MTHDSGGVKVVKRNKKQLEKGGLEKRACGFWQ